MTAKLVRLIFNRNFPCPKFEIFPKSLPKKSVCGSDRQSFTLPETDIAPENRQSQQESMVSQPPIFSGKNRWFQGGSLFFKEEVERLRAEQVEVPTSKIEI